MNAKKLPFVSIILLAVSPSLFAQTPLPNPAGVVSPPLIGRPRQTTIHPVQFSGQELVGRVRIDTLGKTVRIAWSYTDPNDERQFYVEQIDLSYWPTAASRFNDGRVADGEGFLGAGKRPATGKTAGQRFDLSFSAVPAPQSPTNVQRMTVFNSNEQGKRIVRSMHPASAQPNLAFVHFDDSRDLYRIDAYSGAVTLLLTPAQVPSIGLD